MTEKKIINSAKVNKGNTKPLFTQSRNWCFTDFELIDLTKIYEENKDIIRYICWGEEICPTTKKTHHQGWLQLVNKKTIGGVKRLLNSKKIHLENCRGNEIANEKYCKKDNKFKTFGTYKIQGQRTDLEDIKKMIDNGAQIKEVANDYFSDFIRYHRGIERYKQLVDRDSRKSFRSVECSVFHGETGTGKTRTAMNNNNVYKIEGKSLNWFDGYEGEKTLLIDEYSNDIPITQLLNILDGYTLRLPVKGGFTYANWNKVIITTNLTKEEIHANAKEEHKRALYRRVSSWVKFS